MPSYFLPVLLFTTWIASVYLGRVIAINRGRSPDLWMWLNVLLGPFPLFILVLLPSRRSTVS